MSFSTGTRKAKRAKTTKPDPVRTGTHHGRIEIPGQGQPDRFDPKQAGPAGVENITDAVQEDPEWNSPPDFKWVTKDLKENFERGDMDTVLANLEEIRKKRGGKQVKPKPPEQKNPDHTQFRLPFDDM